MTHKPIIIAGFGRSGTTWLSDIISKSLGGLILFEPCHPSVDKNAVDHTYKTELSSAQQRSYAFLVKKVLDGGCDNPWLMRNHIGYDPQAISTDFINYIRRHTPIIGYKTIRWNHLLCLQAEICEADILYILRHPLAVLASISRRTRFWEEFGWSIHQQLIEKNLFGSPQISRPLKGVIDRQASTGDTLVFTSLFWAVSQCITLRQLDILGMPPIFYEDLYNAPYETTIDILKRLNQPVKNMHPSYLFTPAMHTLKTAHDTIRNEAFPSFFWQECFSEDQYSTIYKCLEKVAAVDELFRKMMEAGGYWR